MTFVITDKKFHVGIVSFRKNASCSNVLITDTLNFTITSDEIRVGVSMVTCGADYSHDDDQEEMTHDDGV